MFFCPTLTSPYYVLLLQGIEAVANKQGYGVFICNTQRDPRLEEKYLRMMGTIEPLGIIYCCNPNPDFQQQVEELRVDRLGGRESLAIRLCVSGSEPGTRTSKVIVGFESRSPR